VGLHLSHRTLLLKPQNSWKVGRSVVLISQCNSFYATLELREAFSIFDKSEWNHKRHATYPKPRSSDSDGRITTSELASLLTALDKRPSDSDVQSMLDKADTNGDGVLDFPEFAALMGARLTVAQAEDELRTVFREFDLNGSGLIDRGEMKAVLGKLGEWVLNSIEPWNLIGGRIKGTSCRMMRFN
jgi:Ca2+-binding EF-hand superfamily protein